MVASLVNGDNKLLEDHSSHTISILILQRILPPYRLAFFQRLATSPNLQLTLAYGLASTDSALQSLVDPPGVSVERLNNTYIGSGEKLILQKGMMPLLRSRRYKTVIAEFNPRLVMNLWACLQAKRRGQKFIWWGHGIRPASKPVDVKLYRWLARQADALLFYNAEGAERLISMGIPREKTFVAWNSIDTAGIAPLVQDTPIPQRHRVLYIGRLIAEKKVDLLIKGFAKASAQLPQGTILTIIGDGPQRAELEALAAECGIAGSVDFVGSLYQQTDLAPYFNDAWMSVSPGYVGLSAIHSLAFGVPMLIADNEPHSPEISAVKDGVNSLFFRADDPSDLAQHLIDLADTPERLTEMSSAARRTIAERFNLETMVTAFEQAIEYAHRRRTSL